MNSTALEAKKEKLVLLVKHMRNSTMKKSRKLGKQMYITRHFAIALVSAMIREEMLIASMILRRDV